MARRRKCWDVKVGSRGYTVHALERERGGALYLRYWDPTRPGGGNWTWRSLRHADQARAEAQARELAGQLLAAVTAARTGRLTLAEALARYEREQTANKKGAQPAEDRRRMALWTAVLGAARDVKTLDFPTMDRFVRDRRAGKITVPDADGAPRKLAARPSDTTIGADIVFLQAVLNHCARVALPDGARLLEANPLRGYERPRNKNVRRPVASYDRFLAVRARADDADPQRLFGAFLDLVESLGWRVSAVCQLHADDVDRAASKAAPYGRLRKRGEVDKEGVDGWLPLSPDARAALDRARDVHPVLGELPIFPAPLARAAGRPKPWSRFHARALLHRAESLAGVAEMEGGDFHPYRRAWATARKHLPTKDVATAGGWRDLRSLENCYQQADEMTLLAVVTEPRKLREVRQNA